MICGEQMVKVGVRNVQERKGGREKDIILTEQVPVGTTMRPLVMVEEEMVVEKEIVAMVVGNICLEAWGC